jgi:hypothetical protein
MKVSHNQKLIDIFAHDGIVSNLIGICPYHTLLEYVLIICAFVGCKADDFDKASKKMTFQDDEVA